MVFAVVLGFEVEEATAEETTVEDAVVGWRVLVGIAIDVDWVLLVGGMIVDEIWAIVTDSRVGSGSDAVFVSVKNGN